MSRRIDRSPTRSASCQLRHTRASGTVSQGVGQKVFEYGRGGVVAFASQDERSRLAASSAAITTQLTHRHDEKRVREEYDRRNAVWLRRGVHAALACVHPPRLQAEKHAAKDYGGASRRHDAADDHIDRDTGASRARAELPLVE